MKDLATTLFKVATDKRAPHCGGLLVAEPFLRESYFNHSVISIIDYAPSEGATGVVMNKPTGYKLSDLLEGVGIESDAGVYCGGPLGQDRLYFIHSLGDRIIPGARLYAPGLYVGGEFDAIIAYVNSGYDIDGCVRFFIGYSSWTDGQLEREIEEETWAQAPVPAAPETLLTLSDDAYWHRAVRELGDNYRSWQLIPCNPKMN
ncbi:MAG: YqgE/AlgH family protein [Muribaculaceae bacterium]|nr:YqgE/AlgH family protein [Muribaculaceae bacterium]